MTQQFALAQLRHAYAQLHAGTVRDQRQFAEGLLGPAIAALERQGAALSWIEDHDPQIVTAARDRFGLNEQIPKEPT